MTKLFCSLITFIEKKYNESLNGIYIFKYIENKDLRDEVEKIINEIKLK